METVKKNKLEKNTEIDLTRERKKQPLTNQDLEEFFYEHTWIKKLNLTGNRISQNSLKKKMKLSKLNHLVLKKNNLRQFPQFFEKLENLEFLDLSTNELVDVPALSKLKKLQTVNLRFNDISQIPSSLFGLKKLKNLDLSFNGIKVVKKFRVKKFLKKKEPVICRVLECLNLASNEFSEFPVALNALQNLIDLDLSKNNIRRVSQMSLNCNLEILNLGECGFIDFPFEILNLPNIKSLNLSNNLIPDVPTDISSKFKKLEAIYLNECALVSIEFLKGCKTLKIAEVIGNKIQELPEFKGNESGYSLKILNVQHNYLEIIKKIHIPLLKNLEELDFSNNQIKSIDLEDLRKLKKLNLSVNELKGTLTNLPSLVEDNLIILDLHKNRIEAIDTYFGTVKNNTSLVEINASENKLGKFPKGLENLKNLQKLYLRNNKLKNSTDGTFEEVFKCQKLTLLDLENNKLKIISKNVKNLENLEELILENNEIDKLPIEITSLKNLKKLLFSYNTGKQNFLIDNWAKQKNIQYESNFEAPSKIFDTLYLGSMHTAASAKTLQELGITEILTVCDSVKPRFPQWVTYHVLDILKNKNVESLEKYNKIIEEGMENGRILVHCNKGISRSPSIVIAYLMKKFEWSFRKACTHVRHCRPCIYPNSSMSSLLNDYGKKLSKGRKKPLIKQILHNPIQRAYFKKFCTSEMSEENILFWEEVEERYICEFSQEKREIYAKKIYEMFINPIGTKALNIDKNIVISIKKKIDEGKCELDLFAKIALTIEMLMMDTIERFKKSTLFQEMKKDSFGLGQNVRSVSVFSSNGPSLC